MRGSMVLGRRGRGAYFFFMGHLNLQAPSWIMELPEELLLAICEHLQPPRYEDEAAHPGEHYARRIGAHRSAATVKLVSRGFRGLMDRTARVIRAMDYRYYAEFAAQTHRHAELFDRRRHRASPARGGRMGLRDDHRLGRDGRAAGIRVETLPLDY